MREFLLSIALLFAPIAFAADNTSFTITGTGFGTNSANQVFLGGVAGPVESQSNGTGAGTVGTSGIFGSGWNVAGAATQNWETVSTARAWTATKSLRENNNQGVQYQFGAVYDTGAQYTTTRVRYLIYIETALNLPSESMQVKMVRHLGRVDCQDGLGDPDTPDTYYSTTGIGSVYAINYNSGTCGSDNTLTPAVSVTNAADFPIPVSKWMLVEYTIKFSSAVGVADATYHIKVTDVAANTVYVDYTKNSVLNWVASDVTRPYRYVTMHGAIVNITDNAACTTVPNAHCQVTVDWDSNFYFATTASGTALPKTVLRCNASTWAATTPGQCVIQKWDTWSNTDIVIHRNYGNVPAAGGAWYYAMSDIDTPINSTGVADSENSGTDINGSGTGIDTTVTTASGSGTLAIAGGGTGQDTIITTASGTGALAIVGSGTGVDPTVTTASGHGYLIAPTNDIPIDFQQMRRRRRFGDVPVTNDYYYNKVVSNEH